MLFWSHTCWSIVQDFDPASMKGYASWLLSYGEKLQNHIRTMDCLFVYLFKRSFWLIFTYGVPNFVLELAWTKKEVMGFSPWSHDTLLQICEGRRFTFFEATQNLCHWTVYHLRWCDKIIKKCNAFYCRVPSLPKSHLTVPNPEFQF